MAQLAQASAATEYGQLIDFVRSMFTMNQLLRYAREEKDLNVPEDPLEVLSLLSSPPNDFDADFRARLKELKRENEQEDEGLPPEVESILGAGLSPFETFIEVVTQVRQSFHLKGLTGNLDKVFQKNGEWGALAQGRSKVNPRRWHLGGRLLEVLVQLSVLKVDETEEGKRFHSEDILVEDFLGWIERRYGFVIGPSVTDPDRRPVTLDQHQAYRDNVKALKDRLREIGFYDDLSDAFNAQRIRPRYPVARSESPK
jgi:hypothetical protein